MTGNLDFFDDLKRTKKPIVLYGAGVIGEMCSYAFKSKNIKIDYFIDTSIDKQSKKLHDIKILSPQILEETDKDTNIFISNNYYSPLKKDLNEKNFKNVYDCSEILNSVDFSKSKLSINPLKIERWIAFYNAMVKKEKFLQTKKLYVKSLDVQVTEKCSLGCKDCSNLMQYYEKPKDSELSVLMKSIDRFMHCVDEIFEFRVLGGDPFMNKDLHKIIDYLASFKKVNTIAIYTNVRFIPKNQNFDCLKNPKVILDISDYVLLDQKQRKADDFIKILDENNIKYNLARMSVWTDSGRILPFQKRTEKEKENVFNYCCNSDIISLLHGNLYRCPFSANATNLNAIPKDSTDIVDLSDETIPFETLRNEIYNLVYNKKYITACNYCNGRDFNTKKIEAAIQKPSNKPLEYKKF